VCLSCIKITVTALSENMLIPALIFKKRKYFLFLFFLFFFSFFFYYSYVHTRLGSFLPPAPTPSLTTHSTLSLSLLPPQYPAETILPLSLILL
jgi:hypothetical protein